MDAFASLLLPVPGVRSARYAYAYNCNAATKEMGCVIGESCMTNRNK